VIKETSDLWFRNGWFYSHWSNSDQCAQFNHIVREILLIYGGVFVAKQRRAEVKNGLQWTGFVNRRLTVAERGEFEQLGWTADKVFVDVMELVIGGLKLTVNADVGQQTVTASLTGLPKGETRKTYTLTARARDIETALALLLFKHRELLGGDWQTALEDDSLDYE
jgi:hypothetical protein